ncbi:MAG TPA: recombination mediator RecR [Terriglobales bacterium]|nr:recombination mediator RecR [Terriglobales bacterium]
MDLAPPLTRLIDALRRLPGIGQKSAQRIAFHLMRGDEAGAMELAAAVRGVKEQLRFCSVCNNITDREVCLYCSDPQRDATVVCVVEEPHNILAVEKSRMFRGQYHVLGGAIAPLAGVGPEQLQIPSLIERLRAQRPDGTPVVQEIILATDPNAEGEATALYLARLLKPLGVRVSRIGMGIPVGSEIEHADEVTMTKALEGRREL